MWTRTRVGHCLLLCLLGASVVTAQPSSASGVEPPRAAARAATTVTGFATTRATLLTGGEIADRVAILPRAARPVTVQYRRSGTTAFKAALTGRTAPDGGYEVRLQPPAKGVWEYRLKVPATRRAGPAVTSVRTVVARGRATRTVLQGFPSTPITVAPGAAVVDRVTITPAASRVVELWTRVTGQGSFTLAGSGRSDRAGRYRSVFTPTKPARWEVRLVVRASRTARAVASGTRAVSVAAAPTPPQTAPVRSKPVAVLLVGGQWPPPSPPVVRLPLGFNFAFNFSASSASPGAQLTAATLDLGDGSAPVTVPFNPGPSWYYVAPYTTSGTWVVTLTVTDSSGQTSEPARVTVVLVPDPTLSLSVGAAQAGSPVTMTLNPWTPEGTSFTSYSLDISDGFSVSGTTPPSSISHTFDRGGTYEVYVSATNDVGGGAYEQLTVHVRGDATTAVLVTNGEVQPQVRLTAPDSVFFDASGSYVGPTGSLLSARLDFGDGTQPVDFGGDASQWSTAHSYPSPGTFPVTLQVKDSEGTVSTATSEVRVFARPTVSIRLAGAAVAGSPTAFDVVATTPTGTAIQYFDVWADADGAEQSGDSAPPASLSITFLHPGSYTVQIYVVNDAGGSATDQVPVTVT